MSVLSQFPFQDPDSPQDLKLYGSTEWLLSNIEAEFKNIPQKKDTGSTNDPLGCILAMAEVVGLPLLTIICGIDINLNSYNLAQMSLITIRGNIVTLKWSIDSFQKYVLPFAKNYFDCLNLGVDAVPTSVQSPVVPPIESIELQSVCFSYRDSVFDAFNDEDEFSSDESENTESPAPMENQIPEEKESKFLSLESEMEKQNSETSEVDSQRTIPLKNALDNFSFRFELGKVYSIVGKNGSGKSTLVNILTTLYTPSEGRLMVNGEPVVGEGNSEWLQHLAVAPQEGAFLRDSTMRENIGLGLTNLLESDPDNEIEEEARRNGILDFVGLNTFYGDKERSKAIPGVDKQEWTNNLSGGQWQSIALARTFCRKKKATVFLLDEPSSDLDPQREHQLFERLRSEKENRITIFISHRLQTCRASDCILVMDKGRLVQTGTHAALLKEVDGIYANLYRLQNDNWHDDCE
jgi:ABC-type multidrug transport system fused ATPase/permease subunit